MGELLQFLRDSLQFLWPFRIVRQFEAGVVYVFGKYWRTVGPGCYPVLPWFTTILSVANVPAIVGTGRQDVTLADGTVVSFSATATVQVLDPALALNGVDDYTETTQELIASVLADKMASVAPHRLAPENRRRLVADLERWVASEAILYGVQVTKVRFTNFLFNARTIRLVQDRETGTAW